MNNNQTNSNGKINSSNNGNNLLNSVKKTSFSTIAKIVVIVIVVLLIIYFCYLIIKDFISISNSSPYFISSIADGNTTKIVDAQEVKPSMDSRYGTEFTYSTWLYVKDSNFTNTGNTGCTSENLHNVFIKGSDDYSTSHVPLLQSPGVWLSPNDNKLVVIMNTFNNYAERCDVGNIPVNKWFHFTVMLIGNSLDIYINCNLKKRCKLSGVPKINYEDLRISGWGGFSGYVSKFRYFNYAIEPYQISQICNEGPASMDSLVTDQIKPPYLAPDYWTTTGFPKAIK